MNRAIWHTMGSGWTPLWLGSSLKAWWDPEIGITKDGGTDRVSSWVERVGAVNAAQPTGGSQPLWLATGMNGRQALEFDASRLLQDATLASAVTFPLTFVVIGTIVAARNYGRFVGKGAGSSPGGLDYNAAGYLYIYNGSEGRLTMSLDPTNRHLYVATYNGASSTGSIDGAAPSTINPGTSISSIQTFDIGGSKGAASVRHNGKIGDVMVISGALSTSELQQLSRWAKNRWGI